MIPDISFLLISALGADVANFMILFLVWVFSCSVLVLLGESIGSRLPKLQEDNPIYILYRIFRDFIYHSSIRK